MPFVFNTNNRLISRWDGTSFQEEALTLSGADGIVVTSNASQFTISGNQAAVSGALQTDINSRVLRAGDTMTGFLTLNADPTSNLHAATKQYVDGQVIASSFLVVEEANSLVYSGSTKLDFGHALDVVSGTGEAQIAVDESEFTNVVFVSGTQTVVGLKTFSPGIITPSVSAVPAGNLDLIATSGNVEFHVSGTVGSRVEFYDSNDFLQWFFEDRNNNGNYATLRYANDTGFGGVIAADTTDGSDDSAVYLCGGGGEGDQSRGGYLSAFGNEAGGNVEIQAGDIAGALIAFATSGGTVQWIINRDGTYYPGANIAQDIGISGTNSVRNIYANTFLSAGSPGIKMTRDGTFGILDTTESNDLVIRRNGVTQIQLTSTGVSFPLDVTVLGNFAVMGTTTTLNTEQLLVEDNIITLNSTVTGTPVLSGGIVIERGSSTDALLVWDEIADYWAAGLSGALGTDYHRIILQPNLDAVSGNLQTDINSRVLRAGDTMTGFLTLFADPTASGHAANKFYVDTVAAAAASSGSLVVQEAGATVYTGLVGLDFGAGFDVTSGTNEAIISLDLSETDAVRTTTDQTVSGVKTFVDGILVDDITAIEGADLNLTSPSGFVILTSVEDDIELYATSGNITFESGDEIYVVVPSGSWTFTQNAFIPDSAGISIGVSGSVPVDYVWAQTYLTGITQGAVVSGLKLTATSGAGVIDTAQDNDILFNRNGVLHAQLGTAGFDFTTPVALASGVEPATVTGIGREGEIRWADDFLYVCVATNSWKRVALSQF